MLGEIVLFVIYYCFSEDISESSKKHQFCKLFDKMSGSQDAPKTKTLTRRSQDALKTVQKRPVTQYVWSISWFGSFRIGAHHVMDRNCLAHLLATIFKPENKKKRVENSNLYWFLGMSGTKWKPPFSQFSFAAVFLTAENLKKSNFD